MNVITMTFLLPDMPERATVRVFLLTHCGAACLQRVEMVRLTGDMQSEACALYHLGNCFRAIGRLEEALEYYLLVRK